MGLKIENFTDDELPEAVPHNPPPDAPERPQRAPPQRRR
jgi:hypothetical protein